MRLLVQRVASAAVRVNAKLVSSIGQGLLVFVGVGREDKEDLLPIVCKKILEMRIFEDQAGKMNLSLEDIGGEVLIVSQFTLYANCTRGRRPDFTHAADPQHAKDLYQKLIECFRESGVNTGEGVFGADMKVELLNDGPVTFFLEY